MVMGNLACTTHGAAMVIPAPGFDPAASLKAVAAERCTSLYGVPTMFIAELGLANFDSFDLSSLRTGIMAGSTCPEQVMRNVIDRMHMRGVAICYGMTETSPVALGNPFTADRRPGTLGLPWPSTEVRVVDQEDPSREVPTGEPGELLLRGPQVFAGYWDRPDETAHQLLPDGWLRTGDVVRIEPDGFVVLIDRMKEMIVSAGFKVYPSQVEDRLRAMPGIADVAVVGEPSATHGESVVAAVVLEDGVHGIDLEAVRAWCAQRLARYALPRRLVVLPDLPRSQVGKVLRRVVREMVVALPRPPLPTSQ
jgi:long-chain acyl-CoA synthetase